MLDARKGEVYACRYDVGCLPLPITEEAAIAPRCLVSHITAPTIFAGEGALVYRELLVTSLGELAIIPDPVFHLPRPGHIIPLVAKLFSAGEGQRPEETLPVYLRQSEAELARRNRVLDAGDSG
jgi:tRNA threonylcarbamoyladenosine biosynthesis protein TsaB